MNSVEEAKGLSWRNGGARSQSLAAPLPKTIVPGWAWAVTLLLVAWGITTANPKISVFSVILLPVFGLLLWRVGEPPVLMFACMMQWLQAAGAIFYTNGLGKSLIDSGGPAFEKATWLSLFGVLSLALGMRVASIRFPPPSVEKFKTEISALSPARLFIAFVALFIISVAVQRVAFRFPRVAQSMLALTSLKWVPAFLLAYAVLERRKGYTLLFAMVASEFVMGLLAYFAGFKDVFFVLTVVLLTSKRHRLPLARWASVILLLVGLLFLSSIWTSIRGEYREFLNRGTGEQVVLEPVDKRIAKLAELLDDLNAEKIAEGWEASLLRLSYVDFFGHCIRSVPSAMPYEKGALWLGAVQHVLMPRLFFPDKPVISDSLRTQKYTGLYVAGEEQGTSIGIGYMAESYIDFGPYLMFVPVFLLGVFYGLTYRLFATRNKNVWLGIAVGSSILIFGAYHIETSNIKLVGGNTMWLLVLGVLYWRFGGLFLKLVSAPVRTAVKRRKVRGARHHEGEGPPKL